VETPRALLTVEAVIVAAPGASACSWGVAESRPELPPLAQPEFARVELEIDRNETCGPCRIPEAGQRLSKPLAGQAEGPP
jgi:hypothetical protein